MEAIGAVASFIAIGEAVTTIPSLIHKIRAFANSQADFAELLNELTSIQIQLESVENTVRVLTSSDVHKQFGVSEPPCLISAQFAIESICRDLQNVVKTCVKTTGPNNTPKVRKIKWWWKSKDVDALVAKLRNSRHQLHLALSDVGFLTHGKVLLNILEVVQVQSYDIPTPEPNHNKLFRGSIPIPSHRRLPENETFASIGDMPEAKATDHSQRSEQNSTSHLGTVHGKRRVLHPQDTAAPMVADQAMFAVQVSPTQPSSCSPKCRCQCHTGKTTYQSPGWLRPFLGSFFLQYNSLPLTPGTRTCDRPGCRSSTSTVRFKYYFPGRLLKRAISLSVSTYSFLGDGASLCFQVPRIIEYNDDIWQCVENNRFHRFRNLLTEQGFRPNDCDSKGLTILRHVIGWGQYDILEFLITTWNIGQGRQQIQSQAILEARNDLLFFSHHLSEREARLLETVVALDETDDDEQVLSGPQAVRQGIDALKRLLETDTAAVRHTDSYDATALHKACVLGDMDAVGLLVGAGAPLNARDCEGKTPLMIALLYEHYDCARALINEAGCDFEVVNNSGYNALWYAMKTDITPTFEMMQRMISRQPTIALTRDIYDDTPLHWLRKVCGPPDLAERLLRLLLRQPGAGATPEAPNNLGQTPLVNAVVQNNALAVGLLLQEGANPNAPPDRYGRNILHYAALYADLDVLRVLNDAKLIGVDVDTIDKNGYTPLDRWRWRRYTGEEDLFPGMTCPTKEENMAFEALLWGVRDRTFQADIALCESILQAAREEDYLRAKELIEPVVATKGQRQKYKGCAALSTNILLQIKAGSWETAISELEDMIESRRRRIGVPPFQEESNYYYADNSYGDSESDEDESEGEEGEFDDEGDYEEEDDGGDDYEEDKEEEGEDVDENPNPYVTEMARSLTPIAAK